MVIYLCVSVLAVRHGQYLDITYRTHRYYVGGLMRLIFFGGVILLSWMRFNGYAMTCDRSLQEHKAIDQRALKPSEISYRTFGDVSDVPLILIHGMDSAWQTFANVIESLSKRYYLVVYDQRGHGASVEGGEKFDSTLMAQDLLVLMDHLGIQHAHILGHSMGARTAVQFAANHPERTISLIVEDMEMHQRTIDDPAIVQEVKELAGKLRSLIQIYPNREVLVTALQAFYGTQAESLSYRRAKENPDGTLELLFRPHVGVLYGFQSNTENLLDKFQQVAVRMLVMRANPQRGSAISDDGLAQMQALRPSGRYEIFENAGHTIHRDDPDRFLQTLYDFLK